MVTKSRKGKPGTKKKVKVLNLNKETVKDLTGNESKGVKGGTSVCVTGSCRCGQSLVGNPSGIRQVTLGCAGQSLVQSGAQSIT